MMPIKASYLETGDREVTCRGKCYPALILTIDPYADCANYLWELPSGIMCMWPWQEDDSRTPHQKNK